MIKDTLVGQNSGQNAHLMKPAGVFGDMTAQGVIEDDHVRLVSGQDSSPSIDGFEGAADALSFDLLGNKNAAMQVSLLVIHQ